MAELRFIGLCLFLIIPFLQVMGCNSQQANVPSAAGKHNPSKTVAEVYQARHLVR
ncbi:MAG: hypothetical protein ABIQ95_16640 [Bdellovibrionia bacterium]